MYKGLTPSEVSIQLNDVGGAGGSSEEEPSLLSKAADFILDEAEGAIKSQAKSLIKSLVKDAIFGPSGPSYVLLHEEVLQQIEDIVTGVVINQDVYNVMSELQGFQSLMDLYGESAVYNTPDLTLLPDLILYATSLRHHQAYNKEYNDKNFLLTFSYALTSSLTIAVYTEKELQGTISHAYVSSIARELYDKLSTLGANANTYISSNVFVTTPRGNCKNIIIKAIGDEPQNELKNSQSLIHPQIIENDSEVQSLRDCSYTVHDNIAVKSYRYRLDEFDRALASRAAYGLKNSLTEKYKNKFKGENFNSIITRLDSF